METSNSLDDKIIKQRENILYKLILTLIIAATAVIVSKYFKDTDGSFILATGRHILNKGIPYKNPFCFIEGLDFVAQQWLWAVICWSIYNISGYTGIYILIMLIYLLILFLISRIAKLKGCNPWFATIASSFILLLYPFISIRPTAITIFLLLLQIYVIEYFRKFHKKPVLIWLIPISLLEINLHASLLWMHLIFMLPYIVPPIKNPIVDFRKFTLGDFKKETVPLIISTVAMFITGFLNPYKINGLFYLINSYNENLKSLGISELEAPTTNSLHFFLFIIPLFFLLHIFINRKENDSAAFYLLCGTTILATMHYRNIIYFNFGLIIASLELLKNVKDTLDKNSILLGKYFKLTVALIITVMITVGISYGSDLTAIPDALEDSSYFPVKAADYLDQNESKEDIHLFTTFNNGAYFELRGYKIFVEARPELYFESFNGKQDLMNDYTSYMSEYHTNKEYQEFLDKYKFDYLCFAEKTGFRTFLEDHKDYELVLETEEYTLWKCIKSTDYN